MILKSINNICHSLSLRDYWVYSYNSSNYKIIVKYKVYVNLKLENGKIHAAF